MRARPSRWDGAPVKFWLQVLGIGLTCFLIGLKVEQLFGPRLSDSERIHMLHERVSALEDRAATEANAWSFRDHGREILRVWREDGGTGIRWEAAP